MIYLYKTGLGHTQAIPFFTIPSLKKKLEVMGPGEAFVNTNLTQLAAEIADLTTEGTMKCSSCSVAKGLTDMGVCRNNEDHCHSDRYDYGPMAVVVDHIVERRWDYSLIEVAGVRLRLQESSGGEGGRTQAGQAEGGCPERAPGVLMTFTRTQDPWPSVRGTVSKRGTLRSSPSSSVTRTGRPRPGVASGVTSGTP